MCLGKEVDNGLPQLSERCQTLCDNLTRQILTHEMHCLPHVEGI